MLKRLIVIFFALFVTATTIYISSPHAQEIKIEGKKVVYTLPYPGILPDNPLYPIKIARDRVLEFFTRDYYKKAQLYLLYADKRANMAIELSQKGKWQLSSSTLSKSELYISRIVSLAKNSKKQGSSFPAEFIDTVKQSNDKHLEVIEDLIKDAPQEEQQNIQNAIKINAQNKKDLSAL